MSYLSEVNRVRNEGAESQPFSVSCRGPDGSLGEMGPHGAEQLPQTAAEAHCGAPCPTPVRSIQQPERAWCGHTAGPRLPTPVSCIQQLWGQGGQRGRAHTWPLSPPLRGLSFPCFRQRRLDLGTRRPPAVSMGTSGGPFKLLTAAHAGGGALSARPHSVLRKLTAPSSSSTLQSGTSAQSGQAICLRPHS